MIKLIPTVMKENKTHYTREVEREYEYSQNTMKKEISKETKNSANINLVWENMWIDDALYAIWCEVYWKLYT